ncbi:unnamed protein product [Ilex paraguariensis]|uniref:Uncharacterized protein n=1 Tax=Ilex paraguariensis TaxID=185542 RepID=A0ABC8QZ88_9AQUA
MDWAVRGDDDWFDEDQNPKRKEWSLRRYRSITPRLLATEGGGSQPEHGNATNDSVQPEHVVAANEAALSQQGCVVDDESVKPQDVNAAYNVDVFEDEMTLEVVAQQTQSITLTMNSYDELYETFVKTISTGSSQVGGPSKPTGSSQSGDEDYILSDDSLVSSSDEEGERIKYPEFRPEKDMKHPECKLGMKFVNAVQFGKAVN